VTNPAVAITLSNANVTLIKSATMQLYATLTPADSTDTITWISSNTSVVTVSSTGIVTAIDKGSAVIAAITSSGYTATCNIEVTIPASSISLNLYAITIGINQSVNSIKATVLNENANDKTVSWYSNANHIATVSANGTITGVGIGTATISAVTANGITSTCSVTVTSPNKGITAISLSKTFTSIDEGKKLKLTAKIKPSTAQNKTIVWSSSNTAVATVNGLGNISALTPGTTVITATASSGLSAQCTITVNSLGVSAVLLKKSYLEVDEGKPTSLSASVLPKNARFKTVTWTSSDPSVASVSPKGKIITYKPGTVQIMATAHNGVTSSCTLVVRSLAVTTIALNKAVITLKHGRTSTVKATLLPKNARNKTVSWISSDPSIATVSASGKIKAIGSGTAIITVISHNGLSASCTIIVP
jgi:uncharacterized protein YjdB